jgi:hypothetical protein
VLPISSRDGTHTVVKAADGRTFLGTCALPIKVATFVSLWGFVLENIMEIL